MVRRIFRPNARLMFGAAVVIVGLAVGSAARISPGDRRSLWLGGAAAVLLVFESLYPLRRTLMARPFRDAQSWLHWHIGAGLAIGLLVLVHGGFRWPAGAMGWALLGLTAWSTLAGLGGRVLQQWLPPMLAGIGADAPFETIRSRVGERIAGADRLAAGGSERLQRFYATDVRPSLVALTPAWSYLTDVRAGRDRRLAPFRAVRPFLSDPDRERLHDLESIFSEKLDLDARYSLQRVLHYWTLLHAPAGILLLGLVATHAFAVWRFYGVR